MSELTPEEIAEHRFATVFRGYDPQEVRGFLLRAAQGTQALRVRVAELGEELAKGRRPTEADPTGGAPSPAGSAPFDADGEEPPARGVDTQIAEAARRDADALLAHTRREAAQIVQAANDESARIMFVARAEARGKPGGEIAGVLRGADGMDDPDGAQLAARAMVAEARAVRERILTDLAKRRRNAHVQLEQLRAAREKLVESLREARRMVDDTTRDLSTVEVEARLAAEAAGRRVSAEPLPSAQELDAELLGGSPFRLTGMPRPEPAAPAATEVVVDTDVVTEAVVVAEAVMVEAVVVERAEEDVHPVNRLDTDANVVVVGDTGVGTNVAVGVAGTADGSDAPGEDPDRSEDNDRPSLDRRRVDDLFAKLRAEREAAPRTRSRDDAETLTNGATALSMKPADMPEPAVAREVPPAPAQPAAQTLAEPGPSPLSSDDEAILERREHALELLDARLAKAVRRHLQDEQGAALAAVRTHRGRLEVASLLGDGDDHRRSYTAILIPRLLEAAEAGAEMVRNDRQPLPELGLLEAKRLAQAMCERIVGPLRDRVSLAIEDGFVDDAHDIVDAINEGYREWKSEQVQRGVVDSLRAAYAAGAYHSAPSGLPLRWILDDGDTPCAECDDNVLAGAIKPGDPFPTGHRFPPLHAGCHCLAVPMP